MAYTESHAPGSFAWIELGTTDQPAAKTFYTSLFGWTVDDFPMGPGQFYSMFYLEGRNAGAAYTLDPKNMPGVPPNWALYVAVESADDAAARAGELGATVHAPAFDVFDAGRMAVVQDPGGAFFMVWQAKDHIGAQLVNTPGALCWNELTSHDLDASSKFYGELFGWDLQPFEASPQPYRVIQNGERANGGIVQAPDPNMPTFWMPYFAVDGLDAAVARLGELGGPTHAGPMELPMARIAVVGDPQGAVFALYDGQLED